MCSRDSDQRLDLLCCNCRTLGQLADLPGNDCKAFPRFAGACRFDAGIEREEIGLEGYLVNNADDVADLGGGLLDRVHGVDRPSNDFT